MDAEAHIRVQRLDYIDHACADCPEGLGAETIREGTNGVLEWNELMAMYRNRNSIKPASKPAPGRDPVLAACSRAHALRLMGTREPRRCELTSTKQGSRADQNVIFAAS